MRLDWSHEDKGFQQHQYFTPVLCFLFCFLFTVFSSLVLQCYLGREKCTICLTSETRMENTILAGVRLDDERNTFYRARGLDQMGGGGGLETKTYEIFRKPSWDVEKKDTIAAASVLIKSTFFFGSFYFRK